MEESGFIEEIKNETDKPEQFSPLKSQRVDNGKLDEDIQRILEKYKDLIVPLYGLEQRRKIQQYQNSKLLSFLVSLIVILLIIAISVIAVLCTRAEYPLPTHLALPVASCPDDWVGYRRKCYYFSDAEADWESSKNHCLVLNASLAVVDSQEEMELLQRYKTSADFWIGLQRDSEEDPWRWTNGTTFNNWFKVRGGAECAYINHKGFSSSSCTRTEPWICSRPMAR